MKINKKEILYWELLGVIFLIICGVALQFTYELSNYNFIVGLFSSTNESLWEHLKIYFFPIIFFSCIEYFCFKDEINNFFTAKAASTLFLSAFILVILHLLQYFWGESKLLFNIITHALGCILAQIISFRILILNKHYALTNLISLAILISLMILFISFTFNPPTCNFFKALNKPTFERYLTPETIAENISYSLYST